MKKLLLALFMTVIVAPVLTGCDNTEKVEKQKQAAEDKKALAGEFKPSNGTKY